MKLGLEKILKALKLYRKRRAPINPQHCALMAIDMQNYFHTLKNLGFGFAYLLTCDEVLQMMR